MNRTLFISLISAFFFVGCSEIDDSSKDVSTNNNQSDNPEKVFQHDDDERIIKKYGQQWDFCDCVKKNDSIDKLLKNQTLSDSELDKVLKRADEVENKCKILLTDLKSNKPSDRQRHQEKVKECLEN